MSNQPTILMVDDDPGDVRIVQEAFKSSRLDPKLVICENGEQGMALLLDEDQDLPDLILLDLNMPGMDGFQVLDKIKSAPRLQKTPVVVFSTSTRDNDIAKSYEKYANAFVAKPVDLDEFIRAVLEIEEFWFEIARVPNK